MGKASDLIEKAAYAKKNKDIDKAIKYLREAYEIAEREKEDLGFQAYLSLPEYLQIADRPIEAMSEYVKLLNPPRRFPFNEYPYTDKKIAPMNRSLIFVAIGKFYDRENNPMYAKKLYTLANLSWCIGLFRQNRSDEIERMIPDDPVTDEKLIEMARNGGLTYEHEIDNYYYKRLTDLRNIDIIDAEKGIDQILVKYS